jgi:hypothetical protein
MSVTVQWDNDQKTIIRYDFVGYWDWADFREKAQEAFSMTRSVEHQVDTISNFLPTTHIPKDAFIHFRRVMTDAPKNRGVNVIVGASQFIRALVTIFSRIYQQLGNRLVLADSLEQARNLLQSRRGRQADANIST